VLRPALLALALAGSPQGAPAPGLIVEASDGSRSVLLVRSAPALALAAGESIHPGLDPDFGVRWTGLLRVVRRGRYAFSSEAEVRVGGKDARNGALELEAGDHEIAVVFARRQAGPSRVRLEWSSDHFKEEPVPSSALFHRGGPPALEASLRAERGRDLARRYGCGSCHGLPSGPTARDAPRLDGAGSRTNARWIAAWLEDPRRFRADASMPALPLEPAERVHVAAYLAGLRDPAEPAPAPPTDRFRVERGRELFAKIGCARCHSDRETPLAGLGSKYAQAALAAFLLDPLRVDPSGRMPDLSLLPEEAAVLSEALVESRNEAFEREVPPGDSARGRKLVLERGCLGCHALEDGGRPPNAFRPLPLGPDSGGKGCLSPEPGGRSARYALGAEDRACLEEFLRSPPDRSPAPAYRLARTLREFRCTACHALDDSAPAGLAEVAPPPLTGAGDKMRVAWMEEVLLRKKRVRPWMELRMPHFGAENAGFLPRAFAAAAGVDPAAEEPEPPVPPDRVREGVRLVGAGDGGLSCISCHDFKDRIALATRGPDLTEMHARMRPDWFRRWLRDPGRIQPGTAMPSFFAGVPEAEAERRMDLIWAALSAGKDMPAPAGFPDPRSFFLAVGTEPVVVRTFLPDASNRAIAVGLPGGTSFCFDAEDCRLRYAWRGEFLDLSPAWGGRGGQPARILGKRFYSASSGFPIRIGDRERAPRAIFRGYAVGGPGPEFLYTVDGIEVRERISALPEGAGLVRSYRLGRVEGDVWFLADPGASFSSPEVEFADGALRVRGGPSVSFSVALRPKP